MRNHVMCAAMIGLHVAAAAATGGCLSTPGVACGNGWCSEGDRCANPDSATPVCVRSSCGNGVLDLGEECDDGHNIGGDGCSANCTLEPFCGNSILDPGEQCDDGNKIDGDGCSTNCTIEQCGNAIVDPGEECDDGNRTNADGCENNCTLPFCGNSITDPGEECDDGDTIDGDGCSHDCRMEFCGDGIVNNHEVCDPSVDAVHCNLDCTISVCGDGKVNPFAVPPEQCDDGDAIDGDGCSHDCKIEFCGDGKVNNHEVCDPSVDAVHCNLDCTISVCGDGKANAAAGEQCDDGNASDDDGCSHDCKFERCGNGILDPGEECDGPLVGPQPCSPTCHQERCGNGILDVDPNAIPPVSEQCDIGPANNDQGVCTNACQLARCGDAFVEIGVEQCDNGDGNNDNHADCTNACRFNVCGDGFTDTIGPDHIEQCDDGATNGDACDYNNPTCTRCNSTCTAMINPGGPFCGDGILQTQFMEVCEPSRGPNQDAPNCDSDCTPVVCGDGHLNAAAGETCDDHNQSTCGTCPSTTDTDCRTATPITPTQAHSTVQATAAADDNGILIQSGDSFTLDDGFGRVITFTFFEQSVGGSSEILFQHSPPDDAGTIASKMANAINGQPGFGVAASVPLDQLTTVILTNRRKSALGNTAITVMGLQRFVFGLNGRPNMMDGGLAGNCDATVGCVFADDCASGVCSSGTCQPCTADNQCPASTTCNVSTGKCH